MLPESITLYMKTTNPTKKTAGKTTAGRKGISLELISLGFSVLSWTVYFFLSFVFFFEELLGPLFSFFLFFAWIAGRLSRTYIATYIVSLLFCPVNTHGAGLHQTNCYS